jgi:hypothetical protein
MPVHHKGGCVCGAVRFEVEGDPKTTAVCHCKFCQKRTGSTNAFLIYYNQSSVKFLEGELKTYRHVSDVSGRWIDIQSCMKCGSSISWTLELVPSWRGFEGGSFDDNSVFTRNVHMWTNSSHPSEIFSGQDTCFSQQPPFTTEQYEAM